MEILITKKGITAIDIPDLLGLDYCSDKQSANDNDEHSRITCEVHMDYLREVYEDSLWETQNEESD